MGPPVTGDRQDGGLVQALSLDIHRVSDTPDVFEADGAGSKGHLNNQRAYYIRLLFANGHPTKTWAAFVDFWLESG
ncbi:MAG: hypothetical protein DMF89_01410 [Acidobacteria bacterium]|nr:MAG: hypothetical protein DMF89_01410 [Acidobacteriota bacterium]